MNNKTLLIYPASLNNGGWIKADRNYQLPLLVLYSFLKQNGIDVDVLELDQEIGYPHRAKDREIFPQRAKNSLSQFSFDIVGISCYTSVCYLSSVMIAKICKEINKDCKVVVGGYHPTVVPEDFMTGDGLFDYIVKGEGEIALLEICQGLYHCNGDSPKIIEGTPRPLNQGVLLDWQDYKYTKQGATRPLGLSLTRGCPFRCSFCLESTLAFKPREYPIDLALRDIKRAVEMMNPYFIKLEDPLFPLYSDWGQELLKALVKEKFQIPIDFMTRIDLLKEEHLDVLNGLTSNVFFGIETCSEKMLTIMQKTNDTKAYLRKVEENLRLINDRKISSSLSLIFNHPGDNDVILSETINFFERVYSKVDSISNYFILQAYVHLPGTVVSQKLEYFEETFGTVIKYKTWWKDHGNQLLMARDVISSRDASFQFLTDCQLKWEHFLETVVNPKVDSDAWLLKSWINSHHENERKYDAYAFSA